MPISSQTPQIAPYSCVPLYLLFLFLDRKPGDIEAITDVFVEDFLNFPTTRELGEDSARFMREEMERTWGDKHMAVLTEQEAQAWLLGVSLFTFAHSPTRSTSMVLPDVATSRCPLDGLLIATLCDCRHCVYSGSLQNWKPR